MAHRLRYEFLCDCEENAKSEKAKRAIRKIRRHEEIRRSWRCIHHNHGKTRMEGVSSVEICDNEEVITLTDKVTVE